jgi:2-polyprenyl-6-methoxyphenol hydroxylase-like FAD-dependent oxidoreductase
MYRAVATAPILVVGGGIGGLAVCLALSQLGFRVIVVEQSAEIGEIGAGIQLGPNAFTAMDALGAGERLIGDSHRVSGHVVYRGVVPKDDMPEDYHAKGVEQLVRNSLWKERTPERFYDALEWLYGWTAEECLR